MQHFLSQAVTSNGGKGRTIARLGVVLSGNRTTGIVLTLVVTALLAFACSSDPDPFESYEGVRVAPPFTMPDWTLADTDGQPFRLREETEGWVTLFYFGYTNCPDICPTHYNAITRALRELPEDVSERVKVVFVTSDPERDTPEALRAWLDQFDESYIGLRPEADDLAGFLDTFDIPEPEHEHLEDGTHLVAHASFVIAFTTDGTGRLIYPDGTQALHWQHDLPLLVDERWR